MAKLTCMSDIFGATLKEQMNDFGVDLTPESISSLTRYYHLVQQWNPRLHLVAPCPAEEFAIRHVLESLIILQYMDHGARVVDVGTGAGLPIIPCLIARPDLSAVLIESSTRKSVFLREALRRLDRADSATVVCARFEDIEAPEANYLTCRALDQFVSKVPSLIKWVRPATTLLFFGGDSMSRELIKERVDFQSAHIPHSERRSLFISQKM
jgi:16S rRNA (guanine527-N7)-methyltransferase